MPQSPRRGVAWCSGRNRWRAYVSVCGERVILGYFRLEDVDRAVAAVVEARKLYGDGRAAVTKTPAQQEAYREFLRKKALDYYYANRERIRRKARHKGQARKLYQIEYRRLRRDPAAFAAWRAARESSKAKRKALRAQRQRFGRMVRTHADRALAVGAPVTGDRREYRAFILEMRSAAVRHCFWCGRIVPKTKRRVDHVVPLDRGGADDVNNLCCACVHCNSRKSNKLPHEFNGQYLMFGEAV